MTTSLLNLSEWSAGPSEQERFEYYMLIGDKRTKLGHISMTHKQFTESGEMTSRCIYNVFGKIITKTGYPSKNTTMLQGGLLSLDECKKIMQNYFRGFIEHSKQQHDLRMKKLSENAKESK